MTGLPKVLVVGLGPAGPELLTRAGSAALARAERRYLRTERHPAAVAALPAASFDWLYEEATTFEAVYRGIVEALVAAAEHHGEVAYAVPGSPLVAERTVEMLVADERVESELYPAPSFSDLAWARLGVDPVVAGVRLVDGASFATEAAGERGPLLVAQCWSKEVLSAIKLSVDDEPSEPVVVLQRLGLPDEAVFTVSWCDLDREVMPDHLTSLYIQRLAAPIASEMCRAAELVRVLRARCPWDREQTHASLARHLLEETYEVLDAIDHLGNDGDGYAELEDELGDLLFQVLFHATLATEAGQFGLADVARHLHDKLVDRHPHVFGDEEAETAAAVMAGWERRKQRQLGRASLMEGIPAALPSLAYATKVLGRAESASAERGRPDELATSIEVRLHGLAAHAAPGAQGADAELGELLLDLAALARRLELDPEAALRRAAAALRRRFMEAEAGAEGSPGTADWSSRSPLRPPGSRRV